MLVETVEGKLKVLVNDDDDDDDYHGDGDDGDDCSGDDGCYENDVSVKVWILKV